MSLPGPTQEKLEEPTLPVLLALFEKLPEPDKLSAIQYLNQKVSGNSGTPSSPTDSSVQTLTKTAHTCSHCRRLVIQGESRFNNDPSREDTLFYQFGSLDLSKGELTRGLASACLLFRWIFRLFQARLAKFKFEVAEKSVKKTKVLREGVLGHATDDLDYISTQSGIRVYFGFSWGESAFTLQYQLDPVLLDQLWEETRRQDPQAGDTYETFLASWRIPSSANNLHMFTTPEDPAAGEIRQRPRTTDVDTHLCYEFARQRLRECHESHPDCPKSTRVLPSRLLDIGTRYPIRSVKLHWTEEDESRQYAALSYCWGGQQPLQTTTSTAQDFTDGIKFDKLPQTLRDAIRTTYELGLQFLWIDCLCIIQDDLEDVAREVANMSQIFEQAHVTISASSARNIHEGFLGPRSSRQDRLKLPYRTEQGIMGSVYIEEPRPYAPENDPISLRAWTLQERILSPRILDYSTQELWWVCRTTVMNVGGSDTVPDDPQAILSFGLGSKSLHTWRTIVRDYTRRFLTFPSDKLPAISGVAAVYASDPFHDRFWITSSTSYLAGLWSYDLPSELLWCTTRSDISRPTLQRAPSWSWAAVDGEISQDWCPNHYNGSFTILDCHVSPVSPLFPYGSVDPLLCTLRVRGRMRECVWATDKQRLASGPDFGSESLIGRTLGDADEVLPAKPGRGFCYVWALIVTYEPTRGLILTPCNDDQTFRRVGMFFRLWDSWDEWPERTVTIL